MTEAKDSDRQFQRRVPAFAGKVLYSGSLAHLAPCANEVKKRFDHGAAIERHPERSYVKEKAGI
jgi:hypothetical protein